MSRICAIRDLNACDWQSNQRSRGLHGIWILIGSIVPFKCCPWGITTVLTTPYDRRSLTEGLVYPQPAPPPDIFRAVVSSMIIRCQSGCRRGARASCSIAPTGGWALRPRIPVRSVFQFVRDQLLRGRVSIRYVGGGWGEEGWGGVVGGRGGVGGGVWGGVLAKSNTVGNLEVALVASTRTIFNRFACRICVPWPVTAALAGSSSPAC